MKQQKILAIIAGLLSAQSWAGSMGPIQPAHELTWVGTISVGPVWDNAGQTQRLFLTPEIEKKYVARKSTNTLVSGEIFIGLQKNLTSEWLGQLGLAYAIVSNAKLQGVIWDDAEPEFDNFSYQYKVWHNHVAVKGKLLLDKGYWLIPWVSGSLGVGFNSAHGYTSTPLIFEALPTPNFSDHTTTAFTYTVGAGVQKNLSDHWQVGVGYEFTDWGKSSLARAQGQTLNSGLKLDHLYTNGVLFNLTYVA